MLVSRLLAAKGTDVVTVAPETPVRDLVDLLTGRRIGAVVVSLDGARVTGIVSERDVVAALAAHGAGALDLPVAAIATPDVRTAAPSTTVEELMVLMTTQRVRHVPVLADGALAGIVSIGDVVKHRIDELERERTALQDYVAQAR
ncbi:CBS domain-containing protein [Vallicoccus soli]|uniref:CBS domain-containing protein n=1 Tax=Vallicoccus soli TaxID=2339232 RepID=A0A3A3YV21_9ACTN|nr:CBS domain-containing protein [Vallicoccus soli]RJK95391.1 CBS domain-containing protein [Vallicoccus soli]